MASKLDQKNQVTLQPPIFFKNHLVASSFQNTSTAFNSIQQKTYQCYHILNSFHCSPSVLAQHLLLLRWCHWTWLPPPSAPTPTSRCRRRRAPRPVPAAGRRRRFWRRLWRRLWRCGRRGCGSPDLRLKKMVANKWWYGMWCDGFGQMWSFVIFNQHDWWYQNHQAILRPTGGGSLKIGTPEAQNLSSEDMVYSATLNCFETQRTKN